MKFVLVLVFLFVIYLAVSLINEEDNEVFPTDKKPVSNIISMINKDEQSDKVVNQNVNETGYSNINNSDEDNKESTSGGNKEEIDFFKKEFLKIISKNSLSDLDTLTKSFLNTNVLSKEEKLKIVMDLLSQDLDDMKFKYLSSVLSSLNPYEISEIIISQIKNSEDPSKKVVLLQLLKSSFYNTSVYSNLTDEEIDIKFSNQDSTSKFLFDIINSSGDGYNDEVFKAAYDSYIAISPLQEVISSSGVLLSGDRNPDFPRKKLTNTLLSKAFEDERSLENFLPEILSDKYEKDENFSDSLNSRIKESNVTFSAETAELLKKEIKTQMETLLPEEAIASSGVEMIKVVNQIEAYSKLSNISSLTQEDKVVKFSIDNFIINDNNPTKISAVIMLADSTTLRKLKNRKDEILPSLYTALDDPLADNNRKENFTEAVRLLIE